MAAPQKTLKTSICLDLGLSIAGGLPFLGRWPTSKGRVLMLSGESGIGALQSCALRICESKNCDLSAIEGFTLTPWLPRFTVDADLQKLCSVIETCEAEVLIADPAYLCLPGDDAGNLFSMGEALRGISQLCQELKVTLVIVHHMRKPPRDKGDQASLPELSEIAWSGFAEFARQWILMKRREPYVPGTGLHKLWLTVGGSAGHGGGWGLDINEGAGEGARYWSTTVMPLSEVAEESSAAKAFDREIKSDARKAEAEVERRTRVFDALERLGPLTQTAISSASKLNNVNVREACEQLQELGKIEPCVATSNGRTYPGFRVVTELTPTTPTDSDNSRPVGPI